MSNQVSQLDSSKRYITTSVQCPEQSSEFDMCDEYVDGFSEECPCDKLHQLDTDDECSTGCSDCKDCENCRGCKECSICKYCLNCEDCQKCQDCEDCQRCYHSRFCNNCQDCQRCQRCRDCELCHGCCDCKDCYRCQSCYDCQNCYKCQDCQDCKDCRYCENCENCQDCKDCKCCQGCEDCYECYNSQNIFDCIFMRDNQRYDPGFEAFEQLYYKTEIQQMYDKDEDEAKNLYSIHVSGIRQQQIQCLQKQVEDLQKQLQDEKDINENTTAENYILKQQMTSLIQQFCGACTLGTCQ